MHNRKKNLVENTALPEVFNPLPPTDDYPALLEEALACLDAFSGHIWDERGEHDPGLTLLELLCYALGHVLERFEKPMTDLIAPVPGSASWDTGNGNIGYRYVCQTGQHLWPHPNVFLGTAPVSCADHRELLLDEPSVLGAWVASEPHAPDTWLGLLEFHADVPVIERGIILNRLNRLFKTRQNLGQPFLTVMEIEQHPLKLSGYVDIVPGADPTVVMSAIVASLENFVRPLSPLDEQTWPKTRINNLEINQVILGLRSVRGSFVKLNASGDDTEHSPDEPFRLACSREGFFITEVDVILQGTDKPLDRQKAMHLSTRIRHRQGNALKRTVPPPGLLHKETGQSQKPYISLLQFFPECYEMTTGHASAPRTPKRLAQIRQFQAWVIILEQFIADLTAPLAQARQWLSGYELEPSMMTGTIEHCPALPILASSMDNYREHLAAYWKNHNFSRFSDRLFRHLLARHSDVPLMAPDFAQAPPQLQGYWLGALPWLNRNRLGALPETFPHLDYGDTDASPMEERLAFYLAACRFDLPDNPRLHFFISADKNTVDGHEEFRFYLQDEVNQPLWASLRFYHNQDEAAAAAQKTLNAMGLRDRYHLVHKESLRVYILDGKRTPLAEWRGDLANLDQAWAVIETSMGKARHRNLPWVRILDGGKLFGAGWAFQAIVLLAGENVPLSFRAELEKTFLPHLPAHIRFSFIWLSPSDEERLRPLCDETATDLERETLWHALAPFLEDGP